MRKTKFILASLLFGVCLSSAIISCGSEKKGGDKPDVPTNVDAKEIAGEYVGNIECEVASKKVPMKDVKAKVEMIDASTIKITVAEFGMSPMMMLPSITIEKVKVAGSNGKFKFQETAFKGGAGDKTYEGSATGSYENKELTVDFGLKYAPMPMGMKCTYKAKKK